MQKVLKKKWGITQTDLGFYLSYSGSPVITLLPCGHIIDRHIQIEYGCKMCNLRLV